jgi:hypothetical protein
MEEEEEEDGGGGSTTGGRGSPSPSSRFFFLLLDLGDIILCVCRRGMMMRDDECPSSENSYRHEVCIFWLVGHVGRCVFVV